MKVTLNWLKDYVAYDGTPETLADLLTMAGLEVEGVERRGGEFQGVVVARVLTREKHPNADKLSVCRVDDGTGERQIVCGAQNFQPGDRVPLILPGSALPRKPDDKEPFVIKVGKIRGVESHGMMCAADELGLDAEALGLKKEEGLLILPPEARVGQPFADYLGRGSADVIYDLEVTPNRPDLNSAIGIARDVAAVTGQQLRIPEVHLAEPAPGHPPTVAVQIDAPDLCPRYVARVIRGVRVGPSPDWLRALLEKLGLRSINNVVDITNFVMLECGQPLHAFDLRQIAPRPDGKPTIVVRRAAAGERFTTLDGQQHELVDDDLVIADPVKAVALAGVMGGQNSEVAPDTTDLLLESAYFTPTGIRRTSKRLGLRTDASYRFERGADPLGAEWASRRAAALIVQIAGGAVVDSPVDAHPNPPKPRQITVRHDRVNALLGTRLQPEEMECLLGQLGLRLVSRKPRPVDDPPPAEPATFEIPSHRVDLKREADLIEEVVRLHGIDRIASAEPRLARGSHDFDARYDVFMLVRRLLAGLGLHEAQGQTLVSQARLRGGMADTSLRLENPLSSDMDVLRPSLLPGLLDILRHNARHQNADVALFELGRVFRREGTALREQWRLAIAMTGARQPGSWSGSEREVKLDIHDLKGWLEEFLEQFGIRGVVYARRPEPDAFWAESGTITLGGKVPLGELGQLQPRLARDNDLRDPVFFAEMDLGQLLARRNGERAFKPLATFPAIRRDLAMVVPESVTHEAVLQAVRKSKPANLESAELFDVFRGGSVPAGQKSVAYRFTYRAADRTLTDAEVSNAQAQIVTQLRDGLGAVLRD